MKLPNQAAALLDPLRMELLERLRQPQSASGLSRELGIPRQKLNYHIRELEREGFVELVEERKRGNCTERVLRATARALVLDPALLGPLGADPDQIQDRFSSAHLVAAATRMIRELCSLRSRAEQAGKKLSTLTLETEVAFASAADRAEFVAELNQQVTRLAAKYHNEQAAGGRRFRFVIGGYPAAKKEIKRPSEAATQPGSKR